MFDFDTIMKKYSEDLIQEMVEAWERFNAIRDTRILSLEARWERFLAATDSQPRAAA